MDLEPTRGTTLQPNVPPEPATISDEMLAAQPVAAVSDGRVDFEREMSLAPPLTLLLITANAVLFGITLARGALENREGILLAGALARDRVLLGEPWRMVSSMFLHGGPDHLIGNCIVLYILGMACEHAFGLWRTAALYFATGLCGGLASMLLSPGPSVGASGAIFGLLGSMIVFFYRHRHRFLVRDSRVGVVLLVWALYSVFTALFQPYIDNAAHIGGLLTGSLLASAFHPPLVDRLPAARIEASGSAFRHSCWTIFVVIPLFLWLGPMSTRPAG